MNDSDRKRTVSNRGVRARLRELLETHAGQPMYAKDLVEETGVPLEVIQNTMSRLVSDGLPGYKVHIPARAWVYQPNGAAAQTSRRMFEELGVTREGAILIQAEDGTIYRAVEIS